MIKILSILCVYLIQFASLAQERPIDIRNLIGRSKNIILGSLRDNNIRYEIIEKESDNLRACSPKRIPSLMMVSLWTPVIHSIKWIELPSTSIDAIIIFLSIFNWFIAKLLYLMLKMSRHWTILVRHCLCVFTQA